MGLFVQKTRRHYAVLMGNLGQLHWEIEPQLAVTEEQSDLLSLSCFGVFPYPLSLDAAAVVILAPTRAVNRQQQQRCDDVSQRLAIFLGFHRITRV